MATFSLPKNSRITGKGREHKAHGAKRVQKFQIYRWDPEAARTRATTPSRSISTTADRWFSTR
jgi:hypothetical protein